MDHYPPELQPDDLEDPLRRFSADRSSSFVTPADVRGAAFARPPFGRRGYNEDEVDAFLDRVEATLTALYTEVQKLRGDDRD